jgi:stage II sporulation protein D
LKSLICILFFVLSSIFVQAELINIGIFTDYSVSHFEFNPRAGSYTIFTEKGRLKEINSQDVITVKYVDTHIQLIQDNKVVGSYSKVSFIGTGWYNHFKISIKSPIVKDTRYDDNLKIQLTTRGFQLVNNIDLDNYIAGVVEAEVGRRPVEEYHKLQAIICRTYALANLKKHYAEGYNLCDRVHCQAYHGKTFFEQITKASLSTRGLVIVDSDIDLITAAFHSNCGGQTVKSGDVWSKNLYYLDVVKDTFCVKTSNAFWEKEIAKDSWYNYVMSKAPKVSKDDLRKDFSLSTRALSYMNQSLLPVEEIRYDWKLRSTYFSVYNKGDKVILKGRGYGHGVGLCQQGAMEMARLGFSYSDILHKYYRGVHLINLSALEFFRED